MQVLFVLISAVLFGITAYLLVAQREDVSHAVTALMAAISCGILPRLDRARSFTASILGQEFQVEIDNCDEVLPTAAASATRACNAPSPRHQTRAAKARNTTAMLLKSKDIHPVG
jgi:hypothetical protein